MGYWQSPFYMPKNLLPYQAHKKIKWRLFSLLTALARFLIQLQFLRELNEIPHQQLREIGASHKECVWLPDFFSGCTCSWSFKSRPWGEFYLYLLLISLIRRSAGSCNWIALFIIIFFISNWWPNLTNIYEGELFSLAYLELFRLKIIKLFIPLFLHPRFAYSMFYGNEFLCIWWIYVEFLDSLSLA